jgi:Family of unknown function (DUF6505)
MKFLRAIRFDQSDLAVYASPAGEREWTVSGAFEFAGLDEAGLAGKTRQAFANGFLGLPSFGRSTFATIATMSEREHRALADLLAEHFIDRCGAPDAAAAAAAAGEELAFIAELCAEKPINTVFTVLRRIDEDGNIREAFREIAAPGEPRHARVWDSEDNHG